MYITRTTLTLKVHTVCILCANIARNYHDQYTQSVRQIQPVAGWLHGVVFGRNFS